MGAVAEFHLQPVRSFAPLASSSARVLVLGSMPGQASLDAQHYYAHPQNAFWRIQAQIHGFAADAPYSERVERLAAAGVAVWDVLQCCVRPGSLDSAIDRQSMQANDFASFFAEHSQIRRIGFNGATALALYQRQVAPTLRADLRHEHLRLPSTSPANASIPWERKLAAWRELFSASS